MTSDRRLAWMAFMEAEAASGASPRETAADELRLGLEKLNIKEPLSLRLQGEGEGFSISREDGGYLVIGGEKGLL